MISKLLIGLARLIIIIAVPVLLVIGFTRLAMTPQFLQFEYNRTGFPADFYGFTTTDRLAYGPLGVDYILNGEDIRFLANRRLPASLCYLPEANAIDCPMFNELELKHMEDVKFVATAVFLAGLGIAMFSVASVCYLLYSERQLLLLRSVMQGSLLTLSLIIAIIAVALAAWDLFFDTFHALFFEDGTWRFYYSDTLIRLYPEQFWFDASLLIGTLTTISALALLALTWNASRRLTSK